MALCSKRSANENKANNMLRNLDRSSIFFEIITINILNQKGLKATWLSITYCGR